MTGKIGQGGVDGGGTRGGGGGEQRKGREEARRQTDLPERKDVKNEGMV